MTLFELQEAITMFKEQGYSEAQISVAFGKMYLDDICNFKDLEIILPMLHMEVKPEFKAMTDEERKATLRRAMGL